MDATGSATVAVGKIAFSGAVDVGATGVAAIAVGGVALSGTLGTDATADATFGTGGEDMLLVPGTAFVALELLILRIAAAIPAAREVLAVVSTADVFGAAKAMVGATMAVERDEAGTGIRCKLRSRLVDKSTSTIRLKSIS